MVPRSSLFLVPLQDLTNVPSDTLRTSAKALRAFSGFGRSLSFSPGKREPQLAASALVVPEGHDPTRSTPKSRNEGRSDCFWGANLWDHHTSALGLKPGTREHSPWFQVACPTRWSYLSGPQA